MNETVQRGGIFASPAMTMAQVLRCAAFGAALWFIAALLIARLQPLGVLDLPNLALTYAAIIPGTLPTVYLMRWIGGLGSDQTAMGMMVGTAVATMLDGTALRWFPSLYGADAAAAGAVILWGAGAGLVLGLILNKAARG